MRTETGEDNGVIWRIFAPKPLKRVRHTTGNFLHPVHAAGRAVTPKSIKKLRRAAHPWELAEHKAENAVVRTVRNKPNRRKERVADPGGLWPVLPPGSPTTRISTSAGPATPMPWQPRLNWGTIRNYHTIENEHDGIDVIFRFIPDDGSRPTPVALSESDLDPTMLPNMGEYARGTLTGNDLIIRISPLAFTEAENLFQEINTLERAKRAFMYSQRSDLAEDCGWAWTSDFKLIRAAPGILAR